MPEVKTMPGAIHHETFKIDRISIQKVRYLPELGRQDLIKKDQIKIEDYDLVRDAQQRIDHSSEIRGLHST